VAGVRIRQMDQGEAIATCESSSPNISMAIHCSPMLRSWSAPPRGFRTAT
jgi:hypothetical protein